MAPNTRRRRRGVSKTNSRQFDKAKTTQREESEASVPNRHGLVLDKVMLVPQTYDPDTCDLNGIIPRMPDREALDAENYEAWGHERFGDDWLQQRRLMLAERNIYIDFDQVHVSRQRALRILEHTIEMRPFRPQVQYFDATIFRDNL